MSSPASPGRRSRTTSTSPSSAAASAASSWARGCAMCDVESYCYLPLLEELNYIPKHKYSFAPEILEHSRAIARHYRLYDDALFQTKITRLEWDEKAGRWLV